MSGYFSMFPQFKTTTADGTQIILVDFFRRVGVSDALMNNATGLTPYSIEEGETPDLVSYKFYGSPYFHWVILMINQMVSVYAEWPLTNLQIVSKVYDLYNYIIGVPDVTEFAIGDVLDSENHGRFTVTNIGYNTIEIKSLVGQVFLSSENILYNERTHRDGLIILSSTDPQNVVHHYIDSSNGYQIDYNALNPNCTPVTNLEYEIAENDAKRHIQILHPNYLQQFVTTFNTLINN